jgi:hypothetical protein
MMSVSSRDETTYDYDIRDYLTKKIWRVNTGAPQLVGTVYHDSISIVVASLEGPFESTVNLIVTPGSVGWYVHYDVDTSGKWKEV